MFGHTFLRIDSEYNSKLLSYAVNYAADADSATENGFIFAIKGLFGGYYGKYSLLPYYDKLKEYRDNEQRDIWEYNLDLNEEEVHQMVRHIWELNGSHSDYYFFTENCSYNMLWLIEVAKPSIHLREEFKIQVIPLATVQTAKEANIIKKVSFRPSKRTTINAYENVLNKKNIQRTIDLIESNISIKNIMENPNITIQQKQYILETALELIEYKRLKKELTKEKYLELFHKFSTARASLGMGDKPTISVPENPINGHRDVKITLGMAAREGEAVEMIGIRTAYHDLQDNSVGFLRGTQIEFFDLLLSHSEDDDENNKLKIENFTLISLKSIAQRTEFFKPISWRMKLGWDRESMDSNANAKFIGTVGAGLSWGNNLGYIYFMADPFVYREDGLTSGIGGSVGAVIDKYKFMNLNLEISNRVYDTGDTQLIMEIAQGFNLSQNFQLSFNYDYIERVDFKDGNSEQTFKTMLKYYY